MENSNLIVPSVLNPKESRESRERAEAELDVEDPEDEGRAIALLTGPSNSASEKVEENNKSIKNECEAK
jgi:hypothetical protein